MAIEKPQLCANEFGDSGGERVKRHIGCSSVGGLKGILVVGATWLCFHATHRVVGNLSSANREIAAWRSSWVQARPFLATAFSNGAKFGR
jgi:hypothetical protein